MRHGGARSRGVAGSLAIGGMGVTRGGPDTGANTTEGGGR